MRHYGGHTHENRFFTRNQRFRNPSRQGFSLISPSRDEYMMEISAKRMLSLFNASILISSENAIPSETNFIPFKIDRLNTHIPDWESRTQRKYKMDMTSERTKLPNLCLKL